LPEVDEWFGGISGRSGHFLLNLQKTTGNALPVVFDSGAINSGSIRWCRGAVVAWARG